MKWALQFQIFIESWVACPNPRKCFSKNFQIFTFFFFLCNTPLVLDFLFCINTATQTFDNICVMHLTVTYTSKLLQFLSYLQLDWFRPSLCFSFKYTTEIQLTGKPNFHYLYKGTSVDKTVMSGTHCGKKTFNVSKSHWVFPKQL